MVFTSSYATAAAIIVGTIIVAQLAAWLLQGIGRLVSRTKTKIDDYLIQAVSRVVRMGLLLGGVLYAIYYLSPQATVGPFLLSDLYLAVGFIWGGYAVHRIVRALFKWYGEEMTDKVGKSSRTILSFLESLFAIGLWLIVLMLVLQHFGVEIGPLLAGVGIAGLALALGLQDTLAGVFSALFIAVDQPVRIGDFVRLSDKSEGYVRDISWRSTRIETASGDIVVVPNSELSKMIITNFHLPRGRTSVLIKFAVSYEADLDKVEQVAMRVAKQVMKEVAGIEDFEPLFRTPSFGDSAVDCMAILKAKQYTDRWLITSEFNRELKKALDKEKIEIPYPQLDVHLKKE